MCGTESGEVSLHDARSGRKLEAFQHVARVSSAAYSEDDRYLATGGHDRTVRVWDTRTGTEVGRLTRRFRVDAVDFVGDGRLVAAGGQNFVQLSPWRSADLAALACDFIRPLRGESWARLVGQGDRRADLFVAMSYRPV